jgi:hypothetical protein
MLDNKEWKPRHPGYDFLHMIEEEEKRKQQEKHGVYEHELGTLLRNIGLLIYQLSYIKIET